MAKADFGAFRRVEAAVIRFARLTDQDVRPLLEEWADIIVEDNRRGVLEGIDANDRPAPPLKYRGGAGSVTLPRIGTAFGTLDRVGARMENQRFRLNSPDAIRRMKRFNNLWTAKYKELTGPRLAPRRTASRVITNLRTKHGPDGANRWAVTAFWKGIVSRKGVPFLLAHFSGVRMPRYDLRGVRRWGMGMARQAVQRWAGLMRSRRAS